MIVPTVTDPDTQYYGSRPNWSDPAEVPVETCTGCGERETQLDDNGVCEQCASERAADHAEWVKDMSGESSQPAEYFSDMEF